MNKLEMVAKVNELMDLADSSEDLMEIRSLVLDQIRLRQSSSFRAGDRVRFDHAGCRHRGTIRWTNRKTVRVQTDAGQQWNVTYGSLCRSESPDPKDLPGLTAAAHGTM